MAKKRDYIYMKVSHDKYELPEMIADSGTELSLKLGLHRRSVTSQISKCKRKGYWCPYREVYVGKEEQDGG